MEGTTATDCQKFFDHQSICQMSIDSTPFEAAAPDPGGRLRQVLSAHQEEILHAWTQRVRERQMASGMSDQEIANHLPNILAQITRLMDADGDAALTVERLGEAHAVDRLTHGPIIVSIPSSSARRPENAAPNTMSSSPL